MRGESQSSIASTPTVVEWAELEIVIQINMMQRAQQYQTLLPNPNPRHRWQVKRKKERRVVVVRRETKPRQLHHHQSQEATVPPRITLGGEWNSGEELKRRPYDSKRSKKSWRNRKGSTSNSKWRVSGKKSWSSSERNMNEGEVGRSAKKSWTCRKRNTRNSK
jgi:hypothetical protein